MSRLSMAVGALQGLEKGMVGRDQAKAQLAQTLFDLRKYQETTLPESQAQVGYTKSLTEGSDIRSRMSQVDLQQKQQEWNDAIATRRKLETIAKDNPIVAKAVRDWDLYMAQTGQELSDATQKARETVAYGEQGGPEATGATRASVAQLSALTGERGVEVETEYQKQVSAAQEAEMRQRGTEAQVEQIVQSSYLVAGQVTEKDLTNQITARTGMDDATSIIELRKAQRKLAHIELEQHENMILALSKAGLLPDFYTQQYRKTEQEINNLLSEGNFREATAKIAQSQYDYAMSKEGSPEMLFDWYGYKLRMNNQDNQDAFKSIMDNLSDVLKLSGVGDRTSGGGSRQGTASEAFQMVLGLLNTPGEIALGKDADGNPIVLDLNKMAKEKPDKMRNAVDITNSMLAQYFENTGIDVSLVPAKTIKQTGIGPFKWSSTKYDFDVRIKPFEYLSPADVAGMSAAQADKYRQRLTAHENSAQIKALVEDALEITRRRWDMYSTITRPALGLPQPGTTRTNAAQTYSQPGYTFPRRQPSPGLGAELR